MNPLLPPEVSDIARSASTPPAITSSNVVPPPTTISAVDRIKTSNTVAYHHIPGFVTPPALPPVAAHRAVARSPMSDGQLRAESPSPPLKGRHTTSGSLALDNMGKLQRTDFIIKARSGSVLSRGSILKTDHYPTGVSSVTYD